MGAVLILADSRSPEMRHEVPVFIPDAFLYAETNGRRVAVVSAFEVPRIEAANAGIEPLPPEKLGLDELLAGGMSFELAELEVYARACEELGITDASVPAAFPLELADHLRANGVEVTVERELFENRRRSKTATEIAGLRRAQRACEAALDVARAMLRDAADTPVTCEHIKEAIVRVFNAHGVTGDEFIVSHGAQTAIGHELGSGPISTGESVVIDLFPRDRDTGVYSDMTRTYVVGQVPDELREYHRLCREALELSTAAVRPGANGRDLMQLVCDLFAAAGYPTPLTKEPGQVLDSGFIHGLGHGVGLEVHESPRISRTGHDLVPGDVITLEPGLYRAGFGGVRLEDILLVTDDGAEVVTQYPYDLAP
jgi:Xaa-Pro aminopeptidase